jgi:predicted nucleic acid-binding protein
VSLYLDTSGLLKRYVDEPESELVDRQLTADPIWFTGRHTFVEVRRNLARLVPQGELAGMVAQFQEDWERMHIVELDETTCAMAADLAEITLARTLDALHLAAARRVGTADTAVLTFDLRLARIARDLGMRVVSG